jgi:hypothetical protein
MTARVRRHHETERKGNYPYEPAAAVDDGNSSKSNRYCQREAAKPQLV